jgi:hypothetical protein
MKCTFDTHDSLAVQTKDGQAIESLQLLIQSIDYDVLTAT